MSSTSTANAVLEAAKKANAPVMIQVSQGGGAFLCGKGIEDPKGELPASAAGSVALALHVRAVAAYYGVPVVMHSDHCAKKLLPWFDKMLEADEAYERPARDSKAAPPRLRCGTSRGTAAATTWIVRGGESRRRRRRDHSVEASPATWIILGDEPRHCRNCTTWSFRAHESRHRRGYDPDSP